MLTIDPKNVPALRHGLARDLAVAGKYFQDKWTDDFPDNPPPPQAGEIYARIYADDMATAELFHVSAEMTELARVAEASLPEFTFEPDDVPSPTGFMVCDGALAYRYYGDEHDEHRVGIQAVSWRTIESGTPGHPTGAVHFMFWESVDDLRPLAALQHDAAELAQRPLGFVLPDLEIRVPFQVPGGEGIGIRHATEDRFIEYHESKTLRFVGVVKTLWLLMKQELAAEEPVHYDRAVRRRAAREGVELPNVRVISLRRAKREGADTGGSSGREYHHQWFVGGHWRQHWYPKRKVHRPVWIAPYVKGPAGAPILGGEKVYALRK